MTSDAVGWLAEDELAAYLRVAAAGLTAGRGAPDDAAPMWGPPWHRAEPTPAQAVEALDGQPPREVAPFLARRFYGASGQHLAAGAEALDDLGLLTATGLQPWAAALVTGDLDAAAAALASVLPPDQDDVVLQADGTAFVAGRPSAALRALLDAVAGREAERTWRLDPDRVRAAPDAGGSADELLVRCASGRGTPSRRWSSSWCATSPPGTCWSPGAGCVTASACSPPRDPRGAPRCLRARLPEVGSWLAWRGA